MRRLKPILILPALAVSALAAIPAPADAYTYSTVVTFAQTAGSGDLTGLGTATATGGVATLTVTGHTAGPDFIRTTVRAGGAAGAGSRACPNRAPPSPVGSRYGMPAPAGGAAVSSGRRSNRRDRCAA